MMNVLESLTIDYNISNIMLISLTINYNISNIILIHLFQLNQRLKLLNDVT